MTDEELAHYGVMGMKWGQTRAKATGKEIYKARAKMAGLQTAKNVAQRNVRATAKGSAARKKAEATVSRIEKDTQKDPARVIASRMTRGEKVVTTLLLGPFALIPIAGTSAISRRVERKQDTGAYDKKK